MRGRVNDWVRSAIAHGIRVAGVVFSGLLRVRLRKFKGTLNRRRKCRSGRFAVTSGSAGDTKRIFPGALSSAALACDSRVIKPTELEPGKLYEMIVSDSYGLCRYHTGDLFLCRRKINNLPDLVFQRRRGLQYSFTGENSPPNKSRSSSISSANVYPHVFADCYLTCLPSLDTIPHYKVLLIGGPQHGPAHLEDLACPHLIWTDTNRVS